MFLKSPRNIVGINSFFLDLLRVLASIIVFYGHVYNQWNTVSGYDYGNVDWGHAAVIVFFVLSGYVIAHTTTASNRGPKQYAVARLSKLYSVVLPAIAISAVVEILIRLYDPVLVELFVKEHSWFRYFTSTFFLNEIWLFSASPKVNLPLWSLSFEFWYYVIFGLFFFRSKNPKFKYFLLLAVLIAGPKIMIMMPIWLIGNLAYRLKSPVKNNSISWVLILISIIVAVLLAGNLPEMPFRLGVAPLFLAGQFVTDYMVGIFIAIALWLLPNGSINEVSVTTTARIGSFRKFADLTFPLYVLHAPLLVLFRLFWPRELYNNLQMIIALVSVFIVSMIIGVIMESTRGGWIKFFKSTFSKDKFYIKWIS